MLSDMQWPHKNEINDVDEKDLWFMKSLVMGCEDLEISNDNEWANYWTGLTDWSTSSIWEEQMFERNFGSIVKIDPNDLVLFDNPSDGKLDNFEPYFIYFRHYMNEDIEYLEEQSKRGERRSKLLESFPRNSKGVEIGVDKGVHSKQILDIVEPDHLVLVDIWEETESYPHYDHSNNYLTTCKTMRFEKNVSILKMDSTVATTQFPDNYFDWVYIDGDHNYEGVLKDLHSWYPKIKEGGIISGDDYVVTDIKHDVKFALETYFGNSKEIDLFFTSRIVIDQLNIDSMKGKNIPGSNYLIYEYKIIK
jgi:hypothetical protein